MKRLLTRAAAATHRANDPKDGAAILAYHATVSDRDHPWWLDFEGQMSALEDLGYEVVPLGDVVARLAAGVPADRPVAALTFDDGWATNTDVAFPALARRGWPSTLFLTTSFVGRAPFLDAGAVRTLPALGVEVELHGHEHADLTTLSRDAILDDLARCRSSIEDLCARTPTMFCYPFARVTSRVRDVLASSGLRAACSGRAGRNLPGEDPFLLRRVTLDPGDGPRDLVAALAGGPTRVERLKLSLFRAFRSQPAEAAKIPPDSEGSSPYN